MIIAFDAYYHPTRSRLATATFEGWESPLPQAIKVFEHGPAQDYEPGEFYRRELPMILDALEHFRGMEFEAMIVDGYVTLDPQGKLGLGGHLYEELHHLTPVIGVAKSMYTDSGALEVFRGGSVRPLYVTALGVPVAWAADKIRGMAGPYRMPDLLRMVDEATKA